MVYCIICRSSIHTHKDCAEIRTEKAQEKPTLQVGLSFFFQNFLDKRLLEKVPICRNVILWCFFFLAIDWVYIELNFWMEKSKYCTGSGFNGCHIETNKKENRISISRLITLLVPLVGVIQTSRVPAIGQQPVGSGAENCEFCEYPDMVPYHQCGTLGFRQNFMVKPQIPPSPP